MARKNRPKDTRSPKKKHVRGNLKLEGKGACPHSPLCRQNVLAPLRGAAHIRNATRDVAPLHPWLSSLQPYRAAAFGRRRRARKLAPDVRAIASHPGQVFRFETAPDRGARFWTNTAHGFQ